MSWHCSLALVEEFSGLSCLDTGSCARLKEIRTAERSCFDGKKTGLFRRSLSGMTYAPSTAASGVASLISSLRASRASRSRSPAKEKERTTNATSGLKQSESFVRWDRDSRSWKTSQGSLLPTNLSSSRPLKKAKYIPLKNGKTLVLFSPFNSNCLPTLDEFSETWPRRGTMRNGVCWERTMSGLPTGGSDSGFLPTPSTGDHKRSSPAEASRKSPGLASVVQQWRTPSAGDGAHGGPNARDSSGSPHLSAQVHLWPTPNAGDGTRGPNKPDGKRGLKLTDCVGEESPKWPTPSVTGNHNRKGASANSGDGLATAAKMMPGEVKGALNPEFVEWLMNWPKGWTSLEPVKKEDFEAWKEPHDLSIEDPETPRVAVGVPNRVARLTALGNGQVPLCAATAWKILRVRG